MNIYNKYIFLFTIGFFLNLLFSAYAMATVEFSLLPNDSSQAIDCDFLEIENDHAICTVNALDFTYELSRVKTIELVDNGMSKSFLLFTEDTKKTINEINSNKQHSQWESQQENKKNTIGLKTMSIDSVSEYTQSIVGFFKHQRGKTTFSTVLSILGIIVFLMGSIGFLLATFRAGIVWGLSCMFLPFVSFVFLFVHWKTAARPFSLALFGIVILALGSFYSPLNENSKNMLKSKSMATINNKRKESGRFQCTGKMYCSEMSSCAEAKFYLRNCPGTKMDGDNDGIPCEQQWCEH